MSTRTHTETRLNCLQITSRRNYSEVIIDFCFFFGVYYSCSWLNGCVSQCKSLLQVLLWQNSLTKVHTHTHTHMNLLFLGIGSKTWWLHNDKRIFLIHFACRLAIFGRLLIALSYSEFLMFHILLNKWVGSNTFCCYIIGVSGTKVEQNEPDS